MDLTAIVDVLRPYWVVWLMLLFGGIVGWALWPSRRRREAMRDAANIPFKDDDDAGAPAGGRREETR